MIFSKDVMIRPSMILPLFVLVFAILGSSRADVVKVLHCPCAFSVSRQISAKTNGETFDIVVSDVASTQRAATSMENSLSEKHSLRNVRVSDAIRTESGRHFFEERTIMDQGIFRLKIRHHSTRAIEESPSYDLHVSARQVVCPVILDPDPPLTSISRTLSTENLRETVRANSSRDPRIVGGLFISPTLLSYLVGIRISGTLCTGTLLSGRWIMTAAHCRVNVGAEVQVSTRSIFEGFSTTVSRVFIHPSYDTAFGPDSFFDIAVAELAVDVTNCSVSGCDTDPQFMPINFNTNLPRPNAFLRVAGFGVTSDDMSVPEPEPGLLRQVDVPAVRIDTCRSIYGTISSENQQVCAGYLQDGDCDSCFGDSGGPLVQYAGSTPVLMGITSFGMGCAQVGFPGVYTNPAGHRDWLESTPAVFTANRARIAQVRTRCPRGYYLPFVEGSTSECTPCGRRFYSRGGNARECIQCPANQHRDTLRGNRCSCRARAGFGIVSGSLFCRRCRPGFASAVGQNRCVRCAADSFAPDRGMAECLPCPGAPRRATECVVAT